MIDAIIQARMTSTRLPGKVLKEVMDRPLLSYLIERIRACRLIEKVILATTMNKDDDALELLALREKIPIYRGSEDDVLDRFYQAARKYNIDHVMRVTGDCPLLDPEVCDHVMEMYQKSDVDIIHTGPTFSEGVDCEILSFNALERAFQEAKLKSEREHVTLYVYNHPELFKKITVTNKTDDCKYRFTVDTLEDFLVVKALLEGLYKENEQPFTTDMIKKFLDTHPEIVTLNAHIIRNEGLLKSIAKD